MPDEDFEETTVIRDRTRVASTATPTAEKRTLIDNTIVRRRSSSSVVYYILTVIEVILGLRLLFRLLGANTGNAFVDLLYGVSGALLAPFAGIFRPTTASGSVLEWSTVIAMIIYAIIAYLIVQLVRVAERPRV